MEVKLPNYLASILLCSLLFAIGACAPPDAYGTKEVFDGCSFQGKESVNTGNVNCTQMPQPNLWNAQANRRCIDEYLKGCQLAKIEAFCHQGTADFLRDGKCSPLNRTTYELGADYYDLCCSVCARGKETYLRKQSCKRDLPPDANLAQLFVQAEFENCCSYKATKGLRSVADYEEAFDEDFNVCTKFGCEHFCQEIDYDKVVCSCRKGYRLNKDGRKCDDIDECSHPTLNECPPGQTCHNLAGSYECQEMPANATQLLEPGQLTGSSNETRTLRGVLNATAEPKDPQCPEGSFFDPHRNICIDMIDQYDNFCLDEKCDTNTRQILEKSRQCPANHRLNEEGFCEDIDECAHEGPPVCAMNQICINRKGFFECLERNATFVCESGLVKNGDACVDVDECLVNRDSAPKCDKNQKCINLIGSYECVDKPKNESERAVANSSLQNRDLVTEQPLECEEYEERNEKGECIAIDVCAKKPTVELCGPNANCTSVFGQARCDCHDGYTKNSVTQQCEDIDECETGEHRCSSHSSTCQNLVGSYECLCKPGFKRLENETECVNINECDDKDVHKCHHNCEDTEGSFECRCNDGYDLQADGKTCVEQNYCQQNSTEFCDGICERQGEGKYSCKKCPNGLFRLDKENERCLVIDECKANDVCPFGETCIDLKNGKRAGCVDLTCPVDYKKDEDGICMKNTGLGRSDTRALAISKRVVRLPLAGMNSSETRTIYRFNKPADLGDDVVYKIEISNITKGTYPVGEEHFKLIDQKLSYNLLVVKPIEEEQYFKIEMSVNFKKMEKRKPTLHTSILYVYVV